MLTPLRTAPRACKGQSPLVRTTYLKVDPKGPQTRKIAFQDRKKREKRTRLREAEKEREAAAGLDRPDLTRVRLASGPRAAPRRRAARWQRRTTSRRAWRRYARCGSATSSTGPTRTTSTAASPTPARYVVAPQYVPLFRA
jgi:hypothetical protein